ncbi:MAG: FAD-dependent oxidoreductase [Anaerolineae bacterium]|nr:FAD-dependent oxidoreductase [Anaerolineae bacterium]
METYETDLLIVGGGSGGFGAAIRAARHNPQARILLIDGMRQLGGTSTAGGVNNWEPGIGGPGVHYELYERLSRQPQAIGVAKTVHFYSPEEPYGLSAIDPDSPYESSLRRAAVPREDWRRVHFEPDQMAALMWQMLTEAGVDVRLGTRFREVRVQGRRVVSVVLQPLDGGAAYEVRSRLFIDCSGGGHLAGAAECRLAFGEEPYALYQEPSAPETPSPIVNGITQVFRVSRAASAGIDPLPERAQHPDVQAWLAANNPATFITEYPNGDLCLNTLPTMQGSEFHSMPYEDAQRISQARMAAHWHRLQTRYGFDHYRFHSMFPLVGIRESHRLVGRYVLREQDVRAGVLHQDRADEVIAFADHALDTHGERRVKGPKLGELEQPYGVPYECLLPQEYDNLIMASRGSSFSHIAASSCRLSRSMMALGEAAGVASALALEQGILYPEVDVAEIRRILHIPEFIDKIVQVWALARD